jgi:hypothetical protein
MDTHFFISLFHIIAIVPFFLFVAFKRASTPDWAYLLMLVLGIIVVLYHLMKSVRRFYSGSHYLWVNLLHVLVVGPLMVYIGTKKSAGTPRAAYEILAMVGFAALGYHLYSMVQALQVVRVD